MKECKRECKHQINIYEWTSCQCQDCKVELTDNGCPPWDFPTKEWCPKCGKSGHNLKTRYVYGCVVKCIKCDKIVERVESGNPIDEIQFYRKYKVWFGRPESRLSFLSKIRCNIGLHSWASCGYYRKNFSEHTEKHFNIRFCLDCKKHEYLGTYSKTIPKPKYKVAIVCNAGLWFDFTTDLDAEKEIVETFSVPPLGYIEEVMKKHNCAREDVMIKTKEHEKTATELWEELELMLGSA